MLLIPIYFSKKSKKDLKAKSLEKIKYHLKKFNNIVSERYGAGIMVKHIDLKILAWYYALRSKELQISSLNVHRRIIDSFFNWTNK